VRIVYTCIARFLLLLPRPLFRGLGGAVGWLLAHCVRFRRSLIDMQLAVVLGSDRSAAERAAIRRGLYHHLGLLLVELLAMTARRREDLVADTVWHGREHLEAALAGGKGVCLITAHLGNWEIPGIAFAAEGVDFQVISKPMKARAGQVFMELMRERNGVVTHPRRHSMRKILAALKANAVMAFVVDQNMTSDEGVFIDFLGHPACTLISPVVIALRTGAAIVPGYTYRDAEGRHHLVVHPEVPAHTADGSRRPPESVLQEASNCVGAGIVDHPEQWLWIHRRWRTRPEDEATSPFAY
jgi:KDO2-lipid IV(A) lauroyltransferase